MHSKPGSCKSLDIVYKHLQFPFRLLLYHLCSSHHRNQPHKFDWAWGRHLQHNCAICSISRSKGGKRMNETQWWVKRTNPIALVMSPMHSNQQTAQRRNPLRLEHTCHNDANQSRKHTSLGTTCKYLKNSNVFADLAKLWLLLSAAMPR